MRLRAIIWKEAATSEDRRRAYAELALRGAMPLPVFGRPGGERWAIRWPIRMGGPA